MDNTNYFWVRVYDYEFERDSIEKGILLDEFYLKDISDREKAKRIIKAKYDGQTQKDLKFAKPKNKSNGIYAILMESNRFFYDRFYTSINTYCFWCHGPVNGKVSEFPKAYIGDSPFGWGENDEMTDLSKTAFFCSYKCKGEYAQSLNYEGKWQMKEEGAHGNTFGYIYLIYNRKENAYYIGQTRFMPFFRWQEHVKDKVKGDIKDLVFSVITEVPRDYKQADDKNQLTLNSIEAWWIAKYKEEGYNVINITQPKITIESLKERFNDMVKRQTNLGLTGTQ